MDMPPSNEKRRCPRAYPAPTSAPRPHHCHNIYFLLYLLFDYFSQTLDAASYASQIPFLIPKKGIIPKKIKEKEQLK